MANVNSIYGATFYSNHTAETALFKVIHDVGLEQESKRYSDIAEKLHLNSYVA